MTGQEPEVATPHCDLLTKHQEEYNAISEFLDHMSDKGIMLGEHQPVDGYYNDPFMPITENTQALVYAYLGVDPRELERERRALLERLG